MMKPHELKPSLLPLSLRCDPAFGRELEQTLIRPVKWSCAYCYDSAELSPNESSYFFGGDASSEGVGRNFTGGVRLYEARADDSHLISSVVNLFDHKSFVDKQNIFFSSPPTFEGLAQAFFAANLSLLGSRLRGIWLRERNGLCLSVQADKMLLECTWVQPTRFCFQGDSEVFGGLWTLGFARSWPLEFKHPHGICMPRRQMSDIQHDLGKHLRPLVNLPVDKQSYDRLNSTIPIQQRLKCVQPMSLMQGIFERIQDHFLIEFIWIEPRPGVLWLKPEVKTF